MRFFWPREHGAYGQLGAPLAAALLAGRPTLAAIAFAVAAIAAFVAQEPWRWLMRKKRDRDAAKIALAIGAAVAALAGGAGFALATSEARLAIVAVALVAIVAIGFVAKRRDHSLPGEIAAAAALSGAAVPVAIAGGIAVRTAAMIWAGWVIGFGATVVSVHRVIARHKQPRSRTDTWIVVGVTAAGVAAAAAQLWNALPLCAISLALALRPPPATRLRRVGFALLAGAVFAALIALRA